MKKRVVFGAALALVVACSPFNAATSDTSDGGSANTDPADAAALDVAVPSTEPDATADAGGLLDATVSGDVATGFDANTPDFTSATFIGEQHFSGTGQNISLSITPPRIGHTLVLAIGARDNNDPPGSVMSSVTESWAKVNVSNARDMLGVWTLVATGTETSVAFELPQNETYLAVVGEWAAVNGVKQSDNNNGTSPPVSSPTLQGGGGSVLFVSSAFIETAKNAAPDDNDFQVAAFAQAGDLALAMAYRITGDGNQQGAEWGIAGNPTSATWEAVTLACTSK